VDVPSEALPPIRVYFTRYCNDLLVLNFAHTAAHTQYNISVTSANIGCTANIGHAANTGPALPSTVTLATAPRAFYLLQDLKNKYHGFKCDNLGLKPTVSKQNASLDIPMAVSYVTEVVTTIRPSHPIFSKAFSKQALQVNLPVCLEFVLRHGTSNQARDGSVVDLGEIVYGSWADFGCAGSGSTEITPGVWRPDLICGIDVLEKIEKEKRIQIKACFASVYDCIVLLQLLSKGRRVRDNSTRLLR
jgi:hypothetical protein